MRTRRDPTDPKLKAPALRLSAGIVVTRPLASGLRFLLLRCYGYWDFPKGRVEPGESPFAAALRETAEETGITGLTFPWGEVFHETPPYGSPPKVARYYLGRALDDRVVLLASPELGRPEHDEFRWLDYEAARRLLVPRVRTALDWAKGIALGQGGEKGPASTRP